MQLNTPPLLAFAFLAPAFAIAGLALASVPILIHLLNRRRYKIVDWAAMDFLLRAMRKNRRRVRFEQWLLLACRCLVLALLGLALSRPLGCDANSAAAFGGRTGLHVFVIDNGFSMAYHPPGRAGGRSHLEQAKVLVDAVIDRLSRGGESVAIITAGHPATGAVARPTYDLQQARGIVDRIPQTYAASDMAAALRLAADLGRSDDRQPNRFLYVLTDATAAAWQGGQGGDPTALKQLGPDLAKLYRVVTVSNLSRGPQWNQAVTDVRPSAGLVTTIAEFAVDFAADVRGFGAPHEATVQWKADGKLLGGGGVVTPTPSLTPQKESREEVAAALRSGGPHVITASLVGGGDPLPADDGFSRVVNVVSGLKALIVEGQHGVGAEGGSGLNLQVALAGEGQGGSVHGFVVPELISDLELGTKVLGDYRAVILCSVAQVTAGQAAQLSSFVNGGGTLMVWLGDNVSAENYNATMLPRRLIPGPLTKRITAAEGAPGFTFDFNPNGNLHPLLRAFAHQEKTGMESATALGYWQCDAPVGPQTRVLNWKGSGTPGKPDPAITDETVGLGRVVFVSTSAAEPWILFTRQPIYTELVNELLNGSVNGGDGWMNLTVGQRLELPASVKLTTTPTLADPTGVAIPLEATNATDGSAPYRSPPLVRPGVYTLATGATPMPVAVNIPAAAADVRTVDNGAIKAALGGADVTFADDQVPAAGAVSATAATLDQGWNVMTLVLVLVAAEAFLAMRFGHHRRA